MKKLFTLICVFISVLAAGAQTSDSVAVWQNGKATMFARASVDSITFVKGINPLDTMFVDMGVSVKWAKVNIGATTETEFGSFFQWGDPEPKQECSWDNYKWHEGADDSYARYTKYVVDAQYGWNGFTDGKGELDPEDDAAAVAWGDGCRMPTWSEMQELIEGCTWTWDTIHAVPGATATSKVNGNKIFFPAAGFHYTQNTSGYAHGDDPYNWWPGDRVIYWTKTLYSGSGDALYWDFRSAAKHAQDDPWNVYGPWRYISSMRYYGHPVRAVRP
ncbi:MAG: hypothetical protein SO442_10000 [Prevotella sp.]|nr:hypothetical protein [Prevotella sp.]MDY4626912.1 hypothetical protein [Prevotella sp.]MDY5258684.1 hypothetical protein [Prevotella sp.]